MNDLYFADANKAATAITSKLDAWHCTKNQFIDFLARWQEVSKHLGLESFSTLDEPEKSGSGIALGKSYAVYLRSTTVNNQLFGKVSVILTNPLIEKPSIITEFLLDQRGNFFSLDGSRLFGEHDNTDSFRIVCEAIFRVLEN